MAFQLKYFDEKMQNVDCNAANLRRLLFDMNNDIPTFEVFVLASDFKFGTGVNVYL